jgi:dihydroorotase
MKITDEYIELLQPDNWHAHFREQDSWMMKLVIRTMIENGWRRRVVAMGNTVVPITTAKQALAYRESIMAIARKFSGGQFFEPVVAIVLTEETTSDMIKEAIYSGFPFFKLYPKDMTTNSHHGIRDYEKVMRACEPVSDMMIRLHHGELPEPNVEGPDKERAYHWTFRKFATELGGKDVFEHVSDHVTIEAIRKLDVGRVGATITVHHMFLTQDHILGYHPDSKFKLQPHFFNKPVPKRRIDAKAICEAAMSGDSRFWYGGDDAFHPLSAKVCDDGCAGCANTIAAIPLLMKMFEEAGRLEYLEPFWAHFGAYFYGYPRNTNTIRVQRKPFTVPNLIGDLMTSNVVRPFYAGQELPFTVEYQK